MVKSRIVKVDESFYNQLGELKTHLSSIWGEKVGTRAVTRNMADFFKEENLDQIILRRARLRSKRGGRLF